MWNITTEKQVAIQGHEMLFSWLLFLWRRHQISSWYTRLIFFKILIAMIGMKWNCFCMNCNRLHDILLVLLRKSRITRFQALATNLSLLMISIRCSSRLRCPLFPLLLIMKTTTHAHKNRRNHTNQTHHSINHYHVKRDGIHCTAIICCTFLRVEARSGPVIAGAITCISTAGGVRVTGTGAVVTAVVVDVEVFFGCSAFPEAALVGTGYAEQEKCN